MNEYADANRRHWDEITPTHVASDFYDVASFKAGESKLFEDEIDAGPLLSRCLVLRLTNQGLAEPFAAEARRIAQAEGLDGKPPAAYVRLVRDCNNNLRAAIERIEAGAML